MSAIRGVPRGRPGAQGRTVGSATYSSLTVDPVRRTLAADDISLQPRIHKREFREGPWLPLVALSVHQQLRVQGDLVLIERQVAQVLRTVSL